MRSLGYKRDKQIELIAINAERGLEIEGKIQLKLC